MKGPLGTGYLAGGTLSFSAGGVTMDASDSGGAYGEFQLNQETLTVAPGKTATFIGTGNFDIGGGATHCQQRHFKSFRIIRRSRPAWAGAAVPLTTMAHSSQPGTGTFAVGGVDFNNVGAVTGQSGTLSLQGGGAGSGSFAVASGAVLQFT